MKDWNDIFLIGALIVGAMVISDFTIFAGIIKPKIQAYQATTTKTKCPPGTTLKYHLAFPPIPYCSPNE